MARARDDRVEDEAVDHDDHEGDEQRASEARERPRRREVVQAHTQVGPREAAERRPPAERLEHDPHRRGEQGDAMPRRATPPTRAPTTAIASAITATSGHDRDDAEVADPFEHHGVAPDPEHEAVQRGMVRTRAAPRPQQRHQCDQHERTEIERREAEADEQPARSCQRAPKRTGCRFAHQ